ncbi:NAD(P)-dependent alcohol dehydrogenase [Pseudonocardia broussonetiae]|uniref:NAD(P)-dependent alcohol dehydrogenase n=1 Tax=Pseudonocardia broussonetiae TaxID=2736640 RepID=A0A6M6JL07_9PSEU|nr:NAD(P)-dependent alcohol dehydrogenase [Pseudonocardia broussonetiae]QJY48036.1 NAD(P)-dependent alcohol dehydrogenase [Pseudonocardia broussonetiae]
MRAAVLRGRDGPYLIEEVTLDAPRAGEVLVEIVGAGMCHTDLLLRDPAVAARSGPVILGHEGSGIVREVGPGVTRLRVGDHVLVSFDSCGWCTSCLGGAPAHCTEFELRNMTGRRPDGSVGARDGGGSEVANRWFGQSCFAEYALATERNTVVVDEALPLELLAPLGCGLQTGAGSVFNEMRLAAGQSLAVFGAGAVGLAAVMAARIAGAGDIVVVDLLDSRLEAALDLGATRVVRGGTDDLTDQVRRGAGVDFSLETTAVTSVIAASVAVLARPGKAVLVGAGAGELRLAPGQLAGRTVTFALEGSSVPQILLPQLIGHWQAGRFPIERLVTTYGLDDINLAEADSIAGTTIKPVIGFAV